MRKEHRKAQVLAAVELFAEENGYPPSYRDIGENVGIAHSQVHSLIQELRTDGLIHAAHPNQARTLTLTRTGRARVREYIRRGTVTDQGLGPIRVS